MYFPPFSQVAADRQARGPTGQNLTINAAPPPPTRDPLAQHEPSEFPGTLPPAPHHPPLPNPLAASRTGQSLTINDNASAPGRAASGDSDHVPGEGGVHTGQSLTMNRDSPRSVGFVEGDSDNFYASQKATRYCFFY